MCVRERGKEGQCGSDSLSSLRGARVVTSTLRLGVDRSGTLVRTQDALGSRSVSAFGLALEELVFVRVGSVVVGRAGKLVLEVFELDGREDG